jgi:hypothetical protein
MRTNTLLLLALAIGSAQAGTACKSGDGTGRAADAPLPRTGSIGLSPGFGAPSGGGVAAPRSGTMTWFGFTPGFGSPAQGGGANLGSAPSGFTQGFGSPASGSRVVGGGSSGPSTPPGGSISTGLPGSSRLSDLTERDAERLCDAIEGAAGGLNVQDALRLSCTLIAISRSVTGVASGQPAIDQQRCEELADECVSEGFDDAEFTVECSSDEVLSTIEDCDVTVAEFESCLNAAWAQQAQLARVLTCASATNPEMLEQLFAGTSAFVPECEALDTRCPGFFDEDVDSGDRGGFAGTGGSGGGSGGSAGGFTSCSDTCSDADDGYCDDGGPGSQFSICPLGTDCTDCGPR